MEDLVKEELRNTGNDVALVSIRLLISVTEVKRILRDMEKDKE